MTTGTNSTDRELLELAAKAAGIEGFVADEWNGPYFCAPANPSVPRSEPVIYRWLQDDGDALRLAVKLGIDVIHGEQANVVNPRMAVSAFKADGPASMELHGDNPCAATRRAITRTAALLATTR